VVGFHTGLRVGDELVSVNGVVVPPLHAEGVAKVLGAAARPLELVLRRPRDADAARAQARAALDA